jgi:hypothetical protein
MEGGEGEATGGKEHEVKGSDKKVLEQHRERAREIAARLDQDEDLQRRIETAPDEVFDELGMPRGVFEDLTRGGGIPVHNNMYCKWTCIKQTAECTKSYLV